jgi:hypothetical protein
MTSYNHIANRKHNKNNIKIQTRTRRSPSTVCFSNNNIGNSNNKKNQNQKIKGREGFNDQSYSSSLSSIIIIDDYYGNNNNNGKGRGGIGGNNDDDGFWNNEEENNNNDSNKKFQSALIVRFLLIVGVFSSSSFAIGCPSAYAKSKAAAESFRKKAVKKFDSVPKKMQEFLTSMLYGFVIFFGVKMVLKSLFAPVALFSFTMYILNNMKVIKFGPIEMYESWVRPYLPKEFTKEGLIGTEKMSEKYTKAFWAAAHRILPACNSSHGEKALILGMLVAGLM